MALSVNKVLLRENPEQAERRKGWVIKYYMVSCCKIQGYFRPSQEQLRNTATTEAFFYYSFSWVKVPVKFEKSFFVR